MEGPKYCIVKYDNLSLESDPERPGRSRSYADSTVEAPRAFERYYDTPEACQKDIDKLMEKSRGEDIDIILANGENYKGPRYNYIMCEVGK